MPVLGLRAQVLGLGLVRALEQGRGLALRVLALRVLALA